MTAKKRMLRGVSVLAVIVTTPGASVSTGVHAEAAPAESAAESAAAASMDRPAVMPHLRR